MKKILLTSVAFALLAFAACDEKDTTGSSPTTTSQPYLGKLTVKVVDLNNDPVKDMTIYVYRSRDDMNSNFAITTQNTGSNGKADMGELIEGFYYVRTGRYILNQWYADTAAVQVLGSQLTQRTLFLHQ